MTLFEVDEAANRIRKEVDEDANIIFGTSVDEGMNGRVRVSVVATGIDLVVKEEAVRPKLVANGGPVPVNAVGTQHAAPTPRPAATAQSFIRRATDPAPVAVMPTLRPAVVESAPEATAYDPAQAEAPAPVAVVEAAPVMMSPAPAMPHDPGPAMRPAVVEAPRGAGFRGLFQTATGLRNMMRRSLPETQAPAAQHHLAPSVRMEPSVGAPSAAPVRPAARPAQHQDEMGLEIPTFLRRQSN
jgi:cell division protein FtsZ